MACPRPFFCVTDRLTNLPNLIDLQVIIGLFFSVNFTRYSSSQSNLESAHSRADKQFTHACVCYLSSKEMSQKQSIFVVFAVLFVGTLAVIGSPVSTIVSDGARALISAVLSDSNSVDRSDDQKKSRKAVAPQAPFASGNLVVYRVGDGSAALGSGGTAVFLDEYTPSGTLVQSIPMPTAVNGANRRLVASGTATSEGFLSRSADGQYVVLAGYDAAVGTASITGSASTAVNRVIGRVGADGNVDTTTALTDAISGGNPRGAATTNGTDLWIAGTSSSGGIRHATFGSTTSTSLSTTPTNLRVPAVFDGQLYITTASGAFRLATVGTGAPTTGGQTITNLPGFPTSGGGPYAYHFADLSSSVAGLDTLYVADDTPGSIQKYSLVGGNWTSNGSVALSTTRGLAATVSGNTVSLFVTNGSTLQTLVDTSGYNAALTGTPTSLATAATNTAFRGIAFAPVGGSTGNPGSIQLTAGTVSVTEGTATLTVTASRTGGSDGAVGVSFATTNGSATSGACGGTSTTDYVATSGTLSWASGDTANKTFDITLCDDMQYEGNETFGAILSNSTGGATLGTPNVLAITIEENDPEPAVISFDSPTGRAAESDPKFISVNRSGNTSGTSSVTLTQTQQTATYSEAGCAFGMDYSVANTQTVTFGPGETIKQIQVSICGDTFPDAGETFGLSLSSPVNAELGASPSKLILIEDTASQYRNNSSIAIEDNAQTSSSISVSDQSGPIGTIRVSLYNVLHINPADIDVLLVGPDGRQIILMADAGASVPTGVPVGFDGPPVLTFTDSAGQVLPQNSAPVSGHYEPTSWTPGQPNFNAPAPAGPYNEPGSTVGGGPNLTSVFNGGQANGTWTLYVRDDNGAAVQLGGTNGFISRGWGIEFISQPASAASVSGMVIDENGRPLRSAFVQLSGPGIATPRVVVTNNFGRFSFTGLQAGSQYTLTSSARRHVITPTVATFTLNSSYNDVVLIGIP